MDAEQKILLVDDEPEITRNLAPFLERSGFSVAVAGNGEDALTKIEAFDPALVVLDVLMPRMNGREVLRQLRRADNWIPIILLTQVGEAAERAMALEEGADDYLNKPFDPHELVARIHTVLRRTRAGQRPLSAARRLHCDNLVYDRTSRRATLAGAELNLTPRAVTLLDYLLSHPGEVVARDRLLDVVWGWDYPVGVRAVDTRIAELRHALQDDAAHPRYIETISGEGYRFVGEVVEG